MISVIIPVYNCGAFLEKCLRSVMEQSFSNLEILVIDDGSTDDSAAVCTALAAEDSRIRLIRQKNAGVSAARNHGIALSRGEYLTFVDADDLLLEGALQALWDGAQAGADLTIGSYVEYRAGKSRKILRQAREYDADGILRDFAQFDELINFPWGKLFRREIIAAHQLEFDRAVPYGEDHIFNLAYCRYAQKVVFFSAAVYRYSLGGVASSIKYHPGRNAFDLALLEAYGRFFGGVEQIPRPFLKKKIADQLRDSFLHYMVHCSRAQAREKIGQTLTLFKDYLREDLLDGGEFSPELARCILSGDVKGITRATFRKHGKRILLRRAKKTYYRYFDKRI